MAKPATIIGAAAAGLILVGLRSQPIGYYTLLRWAVCIAAIWVGVLAAKNGKAAWLLLLAPAAVLFNPIVPVYLMTKAAWLPWNVATGVLLESPECRPTKCRSRQRADSAPSSPVGVERPSNRSLQRPRDGFLDVILQHIPPSRVPVVRLPFVGPDRRRNSGGSGLCHLNAGGSRQTHLGGEAL
jgi:hypothetical protein